MRTTLTKEAVKALNHVANMYQLGMSTPSELIVKMAESLNSQDANMAVQPSKEVANKPKKSASQPKAELPDDKAWDDMDRGERTAWVDEEVKGGDLSFDEERKLREEISNMKTTPNPTKTGVAM